MFGRLIGCWWAGREFYLVRPTIRVPSVMFHRLAAATSPHGQ